MGYMTFSLFLLLAFAGVLAGIVTGLAGASACTVVTPLLCVLGVYTGHTYIAYVAITISLFTDVFASSVSAYTFWKNGNIDLKNGMLLSIFAVIFSIIGSNVSSGKDKGAMLAIIISVITLTIGISCYRKGLKKKAESEDENFVPKPKKVMFSNHPVVASIVFGSIIGFICGTVGAGGGIMILLILTTVLGYDAKTAIGTSVLIMTFTALSGGLAHAVELKSMNEAIPFLDIIITSIFAIIGAKVAANFANKVPEYKLLEAVAIIFIAIGLTSTIQNIISLI